MWIASLVTVHQVRLCDYPLARCNSALATRSPHLDPLFLLSPSLRTHYSSTWNLSLFLYLFQAHASSWKAIDWIILTINLMKEQALWKVSSEIIFSPVFKKVTVCNIDYITYITENIKIRAIFVDHWKFFDTLNHSQ